METTAVTRTAAAEALAEQVEHARRQLAAIVDVVTKLAEQPSAHWGDVGSAEHLNETLAETLAHYGRSVL